VGTTLTPEFWERFAVLLAAAVAVTVVLAAVPGALAARLTGGHGHRAHRRPTAGPGPAPHGPAPARRHRTRTPVDC
jgi:hypothetical protein